MKSQSFSLNDLERHLDKKGKTNEQQEVDEQLKGLFKFSPDYDKDGNFIDDKKVNKEDKNVKSKEGENKYNTTIIKEQFEKDINRSANFCIETPDGQVVNIADSIKAEKEKRGDKSKITYEEVHKFLTVKYQLTKDQTDYILAASTQGCIGGGLTGFGSLTTSGNESVDKIYHRNGNMSLIKISNDGTVTYTGGRKILFDCNLMLYKDSPNNLKGDDLKAHKNNNQTFVDNLDLKYKSNDYIAYTITTELGKVTDSGFTSNLMINVTGKGEFAKNIIEKTQSIKTNTIPMRSYLIINEYQNLVSKIPNNFQEREKFREALQQAINNILTTSNKNDILKIKNLKGSSNTLSEVLIKRVDEKIGEVSKDNKKITNIDKENIAKELTEDLKFIELEPKYLKRFAKDIIDQRIQGQNIPSSKKNIISNLASKIKDAWAGYSKDTKDIRKEIINSPERQAQMIREKLKTTPPKSPTNNQKTNSISHRIR
ncbi:MAG: hypothetical protein EKK61_03180 [Rickettsiales bacterium]|nr:MAG: hypothetical protein EKK61_03180 [Rickettsiales bacterium]